MLEKFIARLDPASDDFPCEVYADEIQQVFDSWSTALCAATHNTEPILSRLSPAAIFSSLSRPSTTILRDSGPLRIERRVFPGARINGREKCIAQFKEYLSPLINLQNLEFEIYGIQATSESPLRVDTDVWCNLVGVRRDGSREQRAGGWRISWINDGPEKWMVQSLSIDFEVRSWLIGPGFSEITGHCLDAGTVGVAQLVPGIDHWRTVLDGASGIDVYGNHGIAVGDIDNSGFDSFYVCQPSGLPNRLYRNRGDGTFEDITEKSGTGILDGTASAYFADFQNRGSQDLLVVRSGGPLLFANMGNGRFEPRPEAFHFAREPQGTFTSAAIADYNRDGLLDIYFCVYSYYRGLNQYQFPSPYYDAQNGPPNFLFRNRGDGTFEDITRESGMEQNNNRFSFAAAWCDYDNDGWPDLYVANDFGRKNLYRSNGDGTFTDVASKAGVEDYGPGMSTCWVDGDNDGLQDLYIANMWLPEGRRITASDRFLPGVDPTIRELYQKHNAGNSLYRNKGDGSFEDMNAKAGLAMGGWSWSCASWDFDNDGWSDLYVANGFVSGPKRYDLQSFFWRQVAQRSLTTGGASPDYETAWNAINELVRSDYSWSGYQRNVLFCNNRNGTFSDVSGALGLDLIDDSRAFSLSDFDHDGRVEIILKNRTGPQLRILHNDLEDIGNSIIFSLRGSTSNRDAIGATVTIESGSLKQTKFVSAGSGFASQHSKELAFGLGETSEPISIAVRWPTGIVDRFNGLPLNHRVYIVEGETSYKATPYEHRRSNEMTAAAPITARQSLATVSTWLTAPLFGPDLSLSNIKGETQKLSALQGRGVLLTFFRFDCGDSVKQLQQIQADLPMLSAAGITPFVVAVSNGGDKSEIENLAQTAGLNFPICLADERAAGAWNIQYRYLFDRRRDMPLPISFLLEASGAIVRIYQGLAAGVEVAADFKSIPATAEARLARAMPFPGTYFGGAMSHDYLTYGIAFTEYGYVDEAQAAFQRAIDADPTHEIAWFNLGTIYLNKKMYVDARKCLSEAVRLNPQDSDAWNNLGSISGTEEKYEEALEEFRHAALANPNHLLATENMLRIYRFQGRVADAQKALEELVARAPDVADLHLALAMTLVAQNNLERGREELETCVRLRPDNYEAINNLGAVLLRMGLAQEALVQFEQSRKLAPDFDRAVINAAMVYNSQGRPSQARQALQEFLARHPDNSDVRSALDRMGEK